MGVDHEKVGSNSQSNESYRVSMKRAFRRAVHRVSNPLYWLDFIYKRTEQGKKFYYNVNGMMSYVDRVRKGTFLLSDANAPLFLIRSSTRK